MISVFRGVPLYDQIQIRGVCRQWKTIVENLLSSRKELMRFYKTRSLVWFHSLRPVDLTGSVIVNEQLRKRRVFPRLFKNIKRLYVFCHYENSSNENSNSKLHPLPESLKFSMERSRRVEVRPFKVSLKETKFGSELRF